MPFARWRAPATHLLVCLALSLAACLAPARPAHAHGPLHERLAHLDAAIAAAPGNARLYLERAELHRLHGDPEAARIDLDRAAQLNPDLPGIDLCRGVLALEDGQADAAVGLLRSCVAQAPRDGDAAWWLGRALDAQGRPGEAADVFEGALPDLSRPTPSHYLELAHELAADTPPRYAEAVGWLRRGVQQLGSVAALEDELSQLALAADRASEIPGAIAALTAPAAVPSATAAVPGGPAAGLASTVGQAAALVVRGPYLQVATPTSLVVRWRTNVPTDSRVRFGGAPGNLISSVDDTAATTEHEVTLTSLDPDTRYFYAVGSSSGDLTGDDSGTTFVTPPVPGTVKPTRVWVLGDSGAATVQVAAVRDAYLAATGSATTDLWLMLGDNAYFEGTDLQFQAAVFDMFPQMLRTVCLWPTRGNHEFLYPGLNDDYYDIFTMPTAGQAGGEPSGDEAYYSFDYSNIHFICLDSEGSDRSPNGAMLDWLGRDLSATSQRWIVAYWHHPPYSKGSHDSDNVADSGGRMRDMRENALPILENGGVDLVLCGHSHAYERSCLLQGHYDVSSTLQPSMKVDPGDGQFGGDGAYRKAAAQRAPHDGAVYVVAGSSSFTGGGPLNHPVMIASLNVMGSLVVEVDGDRLDVSFLTSAGAKPDGFTILKGPPVGVGDDTTPRPATTLGLAPAWPNPFGAQTTFRYTVPRRARVRLTVVDARGRRVASLVSGVQEPGEHAAHWNACDDHGQRVAAGVYTTMLEVDGQRRVGKTIVVR